MLLYKKYLLKQIFGYFFVTSIILICLIWFTRSISFIKYITEKGISVSSFLYLFILILPWLALLIIPISIFIAILSSYNKLNHSNEITILKNSGLSKFEIAKPALIIASFLSIFCFLISLYLMPLANKNLRMLRKNFQHNYANIMISPGIFESLNDLTIYVNKRDSNNKLSGILLYDNYNKESSATLTAQSGYLIEEDNSIIMRLKNGTLQKYNFKDRNSEILKFDSYAINLSQNREIDYNHIWKASERYIDELLYPDENKISDKQINQFRVELHERFTYPLFSIILALIACSFILRGEFNRIGSNKNIIYGTLVACIFIAITMLSYDLMEKSSNYNALLYTNFVFFTATSLYLLKNNFRVKTKIK